VLISDRGSAFANQLKAQDITKLINGISNKITIKNNGSFNLIELRLKEYNSLVSYMIFKSNQQLYAIPLASCTSINQNVGPHSIIKKSFYSNRASTFNESKQLITFNYKNETFTLECDDIVTSTSLVVKDLPENLSDNKYVSAVGLFSTNSVLILELEDLIESFKK
jgi:chemotaxis protein histidine kinase CheA